MDNMSLIRRYPYNYQPAQYVVLDLTYPMTITIINNVVDAVKNILAVLCSEKGTPRVPVFGCSIINMSFQEICQLTIVQGNYSKLVSSLRKILEYAERNAKISGDDYNDYLNLTLHMISEDFLPKSQFLVNGVKTGSLHLNITFITNKDGSDVKATFLKLLLSIPHTVTKLLHVTVVEVTDNFKSCTSFSSSGTNFLTLVGFVDLIKLLGSIRDFEKYFKLWLLDNDDNNEHLTICSSSVNFEGSLKVKCDLSEVIIPPILLPFGHRCYLYTDSCAVQLGSNNSAKSAVPELPIYEIDILQRIPSSDLCLSIIFGECKVVTPTTSWRMEMPDLLENEQYFRSLLQSVKENNEVLLTRGKHHYGNIKEEPLSTYFILMPENDVFLIKSVASSELKMFHQINQSVERTESDPEELNMLISNAYSTLMQSQYNHEFYHSGTYKVLSENLCFKTSPKF